jgi:pimeloyl-ACP methyl ester carboxylesterase
MASVDLDSGLQMYVRARGHGAPAVFIHPPPLDGSLWLDQLQALGDIRQCIALDLCGHGLSDPNPRQVYKVSDHARDVLDWLGQAAAKGPVDIVGLGKGGVIAALACVAAPARFRSLTLICTSFTGAETPVEARFHEEYARIVVVEEREIAFHRLTEDDMAHDASLISRGRYRSMLHRTPPEALVQSLDGRSVEDHTDLLAKLKLPVLAISTAERDYASELGAVSGLETAKIGAAGAMPPLEDPAAVSAALRKFWLRVTPPQAAGLSRPKARRGDGQ